MSEAAAAGAFQGHSTKAYRAYVLFALVVIYTFNFLDRVLMGIVQEPIRREFQLDYGVLGWLGGPAFALLYAVLGLPIARWAERANRVSIISLGAALWSAATAACGFAQNLTQLAIARVCVGIGEAGCTPPAHSVIADYFPAERRASAMAIYALGIPIGTLLAAGGGGWLVMTYGWRETFWILGVPGVLAAILLKMTVREPPRTGGAVKTPTLGETLRTLANKPSFWHMAVGSAFVSFAGYSASQFLPSFFQQVHHFNLAQAAITLGVVAGIGASIGTYAGGFICDKLQPKHPGVAGWLPALGMGVALPLYIIAFLQSDVRIALALMLVAAAFHFFYIGPSFAVGQAIVPPRMRATSSALIILVINLIGYGLGPPTMGMLADAFAGAQLHEAGMTLAQCKGVEEGACAAARAYGLRYGLVTIHAAFLIALVHFIFVSRGIQRDRVS